MNQIRKTNFFAAFALLGFIIAGFSAGVYAAEGWKEYKSKSGVYRSRVPTDYTLTESAFNFGNGALASSEELSKTIDQRPYTKTLKNYVIKFDQTIGPALTPEEVNVLLKDEMNLYIDYYSGLNGKIKEINDQGALGQWGGELYMTYDDPDVGLQHFKVRILFSESTKLHQIVIGPENTLNSYTTRDFFDKFYFYEGMAPTEEKIENTWLPLTSPKGRFTVQYPPELAPPYYTEEPVTNEGEKADYVGMAFRDPVRNHRIFYNVYSYSFGADLNYRTAQQVVFEKVIKKYRSTSSGLYFKKGVDEKNNSSTLELTYNVNPQEGLPPFVQTIKIKAHFRGNTVVVQELMSSQLLVRSKFAEKLMNMFYFHPEGPEGLVIEKVATEEDESETKPRPADQLLNWD